MKASRILALLGVALIVVSILCMLGSMFAGAAKELLQIALFSFLGAAGILLALKAAQKQKTADDPAQKDQ